MDFLALQESLRTIVADKIRQHEFTGSSLAKETGFRQAHISNFLKRKRGLSVDAMDRILETLHLSVVDLLDPVEIEARAHVASPLEGYENIPLVNPTATFSQLVPHSAILEHVAFKKSFLHRLHPDMASPREELPRFCVSKLMLKTETQWHLIFHPVRFCLSTAITTRRGLAATNIVMSMLSAAVKAC
jgi:transcriptional regulator with XRE-family HTH domain